MPDPVELLRRRKIVVIKPLRQCPGLGKLSAGRTALTWTRCLKVGNLLATPVLSLLLVITQARFTSRTICRLTWVHRSVLHIKTFQITSKSSQGVSNTMSGKFCKNYQDIQTVLPMYSQGVFKVSKIVLICCQGVSKWIQCTSRIYPKYSQLICTFLVELTGPKEV